MSTRLAFLVTLSICAVLGFAACGDDDDASPAAATTSGDSGGTDLAAIDKELQGLYEGTTYEEPPEGPPPATDKSVWLISCGQAVSSCAAVIDGAERAAEAIGWKATVFDGKSDPAQYQRGIRQAIAAGADGIFSTGVDCSVVKQPLNEAKSKGVVTVGDEAFDCDQTLGGTPGEPLYTYMVSYAQGPGTDYFSAYGAAQATWAISKLKGKANVIVMTDHEYQSVHRVEQGFTEKLKTCSGCEVAETVTFTAAEFGKALQQKTQQAILKNPDANGIWMAAADGFTLGGIAQGIRAAGKSGKILGIGTEGAAATMDMVRAGGPQNGGVGLALEWEGWAGIDALNRIFSDEEPVSSGIGLQVYDKEHNTPASGAYKPPIDYEAAYRRAWGVTE